MANCGTSLITGIKATELFSSTSALGNARQIAAEEENEEKIEARSNRLG